MSIVYGENSAWVPVCGSGAILRYKDPITDSWVEVCKSGNPIKYLDEVTGTWLSLCCGAGNTGAVGPWISTSNWINPPNWAAGSASGEINCSYFEGNPPPSMGTTAPAAALTGVWWDGNFYPGLSDQWSPSGPAPAVPGAQVGPWANSYSFYGGGGVGGVGRYSSNYWTNWNIWPYEGLKYGYSMAYFGVNFITIQDHRNLMTWGGGSVIPSLPPGSHVEWGPELAAHAAPPILPESLTITVLSLADPNRAGGAITMWRSPMMAPGTPIPAFHMPGPTADDGWVNVGTQTYDASDAPLVFNLNLAGVHPPTPDRDWYDGDIPSMAFALVSETGSWIDPNPHPPDSSHYEGVYTWSGLAFNMAYGPGQVTYRWSTM